MMHYEKNISKNMLKVIFGEKDMTFVRKYMQEVSNRSQLWLQQVTNGLYIKPTTPYVMTKALKMTFLHMIKKLKTPINYAGSLRTKVEKEGKLWGLKSHEYHILM